MLVRSRSWRNSLKSGHFRRPVCWIRLVGGWVGWLASAAQDDATKSVISLLEDLDQAQWEAGEPLGSGRAACWLAGGGGSSGLFVVDLQADSEREGPLAVCA
jgi:hypothetical protein